MTPLPRRPSSGIRLSTAGASALGSLLSGLDGLEPILELPDTPLTATPPVSFGRYRLLSRLGAGRFGIVVLAEEPGLSRLVALKVPSPTALTEPELRERFIREGRAAAGLDHPNIVPVFDAGEVNGLPFLAAAYVAGPTLARWRENHPGPVDATEAVQLVAAMAGAIHHAHEHGVLHCDLSPSNVLLHAPESDSQRLGDYRPAITDFGFARMLDDDPAATRSACVVGTPLYMSPEQARGERRNLTARSDVYALGAILYDLLTGTTPFRGSGSQSILEQVQGGSPARPRTLVHHLSRDLEAVCLKCLEKNPTDRYESAAALAEDLNRYLKGEPTRARPLSLAGSAARWARRKPHLAVVGLLAAVAWGAIPAILVEHQRRLDVESTTRLSAEQAAREADQRSQLSDFYASLERLRQRRANPAPGWADESLAEIRSLAAHPQASQASAELRTEAAAALAAVDLRHVRTLAEGFSAYSVAFSPDGASLALAGWHWNTILRSARVLIVHPETGKTLRELNAPLDPSWALLEGAPDGLRSIAFSPDGRWLVAGTRSGQLIRWDLKQDAPTPVVWAAHGHEIRDRRKVRAYKLHFSRDGGQLFSATEQTTRIWNVNDQWKAVEAAPRIFVVTNGDSAKDRVPVMVGLAETSELSIFNPGTGAIQGIGVTGGVDFTTTLDGRLAAIHTDTEQVFCLVAVEPGARPISLRSPDRAREERLSITDLSFSPSGALLAASEEHKKRIKLWDVSAGQMLVDRPISGGSGRFAFSPDGRSVAIAEDVRTVLYSITGRVRDSLAISPRRWVRAAATSRDGRFLAVLASDRYETSELATWEVPKEHLPQLRQLKPINARATPNFQVALASGHEPAYVVGAPPSADDSRDWLHLGDERTLQLNNISALASAPDERLWIAEPHQVWIDAKPPHERTVVLENDPLARGAGMVFRCVAPGRTCSAVGRRDGMVFILETGRKPVAVRAVSSAITSLALSEDESRILVGSESGEVALLDRSGAVRKTLRPQRTDVTAVCAMADGFITGSSDRTIRFLDANLNLIFTLPSVGPVKSLALTDDGNTLTVHLDGERGIRRWHLDRLNEEWSRLGLPTR